MPHVDLGCLVVERVGIVFTCVARYQRGITLGLYVLTGPLRQPLRLSWTKSGPEVDRRRPLQTTSGPGSLQTTSDHFDPLQSHTSY